MALSGNKLAGGNPKDGRVDDDFYATDPKAVKMLLNILRNDLKYIPEDTEFYAPKLLLEPCVGEGHIADTVNRYYNDYFLMTGLDIVDRGWSNGRFIKENFLTWKYETLYDLIITNPPYSLAKEFVEKSMECLKIGGIMAMFLKIQFLEGAKRKELFDKYPPKYIYVFRNRMATWNNGQPKDPKTGKKWATTMCHAWFIWEKGNRSEPIVRWL